MLKGILVSVTVMFKSSKCKNPHIIKSNFTRINEVRSYRRRPEKWKINNMIGEILAESHVIITFLILGGSGRNFF